MMSPMEFYSSITPDCTTLHGVGSAAHVKVTQEEIDSGKVIKRDYIVLVLERINSASHPQFH